MLICANKNGVMYPLNGAYIKKTDELHLLKHSDCIRFDSVGCKNVGIGIVQASTGVGGIYSMHTLKSTNMNASMSGYENLTIVASGLPEWLMLNENYTLCSPPNPNYNSEQEDSLENCPFILPTAEESVEVVFSFYTGGVLLESKTRTYEVSSTCLESNDETIDIVTYSGEEFSQGTGVRLANYDSDRFYGTPYSITYELMPYEGYELPTWISITQSGDIQGECPTEESFNIFSVKASAIGLAPITRKVYLYCTGVPTIDVENSKHFSVACYSEFETLIEVSISHQKDYTINSSNAPEWINISKDAYHILISGTAPVEEVSGSFSITIESYLCEPVTVNISYSVVLATITTEYLRWVPIAEGDSLPLHAVSSNGQAANWSFGAFPSTLTGKISLSDGVIHLHERLPESTGSIALVASAVGATPQNVTVNIQHFEEGTPIVIKHLDLSSVAHGVDYVGFYVDGVEVGQSFQVDWGDGYISTHTNMAYVSTRVVRGIQNATNFSLGPYDPMLSPYSMYLGDNRPSVCIKVLGGTAVTTLNQVVGDIELKDPDLQDGELLVS